MRIILGLRAGFERQPDVQAFKINSKGWHTKQKLDLKFKETSNTATVLLK
jgi:hypothetical protein